MSNSFFEGTPGSVSKDNAALFKFAFGSGNAGAANYQIAYQEYWAQKNAIASGGSGGGNIIRHTVIGLPIQLRPTPTGSSALRTDESPTGRPLPSAALDVAQRVANAGETLPIVFGKRVGTVGGIWIAAPMIKQTSVDFDNYYILAISQGFVDITITYSNIFVGNQPASISFPGASVIATVYKSIADTVSSGTCAIGSTYGVACDRTSERYPLNPLTTSSGSGIQFNTRGDRTTRLDFNSRVEATGTTTNTTWRYNVTITNNGTGAVSTATVVLGGSNGTVTAWNYTLTQGSYSVKIDAPVRIGVLGDPGTINSFSLEVKQTNNVTGLTSESNLAYADITYFILGRDYYGKITDLKQIYVYTSKGSRIGLNSQYNPATGLVPNLETNQFTDIFNFLYYQTRFYYTNSIFGGFIDYITASRVNLFLDNYSLWFNGVISTSSNLEDYLSQVAPALLLSVFLNLGLGFELSVEPLLYVNNGGSIRTDALTPATFTNLSIIQGSYQKTYADFAGRNNSKIVIIWRDVVPTSISTQSTVEVRYSDVAFDVSSEQYDLSDFCASADHAILIAKHILARKRYSTHSVSFQTNIDAVIGLIENTDYPGTYRNIQPTDYIAVQRLRINSEGDSVTETNVYQVSSITYDQTGVVSITADLYPVNGSNIAIINTEILSGSFAITR